MYYSRNQKKQDGERQGEREKDGEKCLLISYEFA